MAASMKRENLGCGLVCLRLVGTVAGGLDAFEAAVAEILAEPETGALVVDLKAAGPLDAACMASLANGYRLARHRRVPFQVVSCA